MGMTIDNSIRLLEDYLKWEKQFGLDGSGVDDATKKLLEVAKKYQKIREIAFPLQFCSTDKLNHEAIMKICEVLEDGKID